jgi:hypothetical protein
MAFFIEVAPSIGVAAVRQAPFWTQRSALDQASHTARLNSRPNEVALTLLARPRWDSSRIIVVVSDNVGGNPGIVKDQTD